MGVSHSQATTPAQNANSKAYGIGPAMWILLSVLLAPVVLLIHSAGDDHQPSAFDSILPLQGEGQGFDKGSSVHDFNQYHSQFVAGSRLDRFDKMVEYQEAASLLATAMAGAPAANTRLVKRAAVMAVALETMRYQPSAGAEFWYRFAQDDGLTKGAPERALLNWLRNTPNKLSGSLVRREQARAASLAWNAHFQGRTLEYCKPNAVSTFVLLGTPWAKGARGLDV